MKKILIALCAVATLASCTKNEVLSYDQEAIGFDNAFVDNSTRSVDDPSYTNSRLFPDFQVYGYVEGAPIFGADGVKVENKGTNVSVNWKYDGIQYWIADAVYNFSAVAPVTNGGWTKTAADRDKTTLSFTNDGDTDLLYAQNAEYRSKTVGTNGTVGFTFRHVLSKVKFSFENAYAATNSSIRVMDIKITDAYKTGNVVLRAATHATPTVWSDQAVDATTPLTLDFGHAVSNDATTNSATPFGYETTYESYNELFMIPGASDTDATVENADKTTTTYTDVYTVRFTVELLVSGTEVKEYTHTVYTKFAPVAGNSYDIAATITAENIDPEHTQEPIEFTVNPLPGWGETNDENI